MINKNWTPLVVDGLLHSANVSLSMELKEFLNCKQTGTDPMSLRRATIRCLTCIRSPANIVTPVR